MRFQVLTGRLFREEENLLDAARSLLRADSVIEDVYRELKGLSQMEECRAALNRCMADLRLSSANLMRLSTALDDIAAVYARTEDVNGEQLEGGQDFHITRAAGGFYNNAAAIHRQIEGILRK